MRDEDLTAGVRVDSPALSLRFVSRDLVTSRHSITTQCAYAARPLGVAHGSRVAVKPAVASVEHFRLFSQIFFPHPHFFLDTQTESRHNQVVERNYTKMKYTIDFSNGTQKTASSKASVREIIRREMGKLYRGGTYTSTAMVDDQDEEIQVTITDFWRTRQMAKTVQSGPAHASVSVAKTLHPNQVVC